MKPLSAILADPHKAGVFPSPVGLPELEQGAKESGLKCLTIPLTHVGQKEAFLKATAAGLKFPPTFGANFDALADCLRDLSWQGAKGWVVVLTGSETLRGKNPAVFLEALNIFAEASVFWRGQGKPFWAMIHGPAGHGLGLVPFPQK